MAKEKVKKGKSVNRPDNAWGGSRKNAGRLPAFTVEQVIEALKKSAGYVSGAATKLQCSTQTIYNYIAEHPEIADARKDIEERNLDAAEITLQGLIAQQNLAATIFYLKTKGKNRGYIEHQTVGGTGPEGEIVVFKIPDNGR